LTIEDLLQKAILSLGALQGAFHDGVGVHEDQIMSNRLDC
jgi:hypothetical protein